MKNISSSQKRYLESARYEHDLERLVMLIFRFIQEKPKDEPVASEWQDIWRKIRSFAKESRQLPEPAMKQIETAMSSIVNIDKTIWDIRIDENERVTFLLGAGASAPSGIPTVNRLLPLLWEKAKRLSRDDLDKIIKWSERYKIDNIEDLLTAAYISDFAAKNNNIIALLRYFLNSRSSKDPNEEDMSDYRFMRHPYKIEIDASSIVLLQDTLQTLFSLLTSTMIDASPNKVHKELYNFIREHKKSSIVTTNYDGCMDEYILSQNTPVFYFLNETIDNQLDGMELIKMHGSINWGYCDSCQEERIYELLSLKEAYKLDTLSYPILGICKQCGGLRRPLLVPPLSFKYVIFPNLINLWNLAKQRFNESRYIIVIGYSFAESDTYITKIILQSMSRNSDQKLVIMDTNNQLAVNLRERFAAHINHFQKDRIIEVCQDCQESISKILASILNKHGPKQTITPEFVTRS